MKTKKQIAIFLFVIFLISYVFSFFLAVNNKAKTVNSEITKKVNPIGRIIGLKMYTNGVLVVGMSEIENSSGENVKPYDSTGIREGDLIKEANGRIVKNAKELIDIINDVKEKSMSIKYQRDDDEIETNITPVLNKQR